jgi:hypothetical protein
MHVDSPPAALTGVMNTPDVAANPVQQFRDLVNALGPIHLGGDVLAGISKSLGFTKSAGAAFVLGGGLGQDPHNAAFPEFNSETDQFRYCHKDGTCGSLVNELDATLYDNDETSSSSSKENNSSGVASGNWSVQRVFVMPSGGVFVQPGQGTYSSSKKAEAGVLGTFVVAPMLAAHAVPVGYVALRSGATNSAKTRDAIFGQYGRFGFR